MLDLPAAQLIDLGFRIAHRRPVKLLDDLERDPKDLRIQAVIQAARHLALAVMLVHPGPGEHGPGDSQPGKRRISVSRNCVRVREKRIFNRIYRMPEAINNRADAVDRLGQKFLQRILRHFRFIKIIDLDIADALAGDYGRLLKGGVCSKDALMNALYNVGVDDEPEIKIIDVFICKLRKKLKPFGLDIETVWGRGYLMTPAMITKFKAEWEREAA